MRGVTVTVRRQRPLARFATRLIRGLRTARLPSDLKSEADLELRVLIPLAAQIASRIPGVKLFVHPFGWIPEIQHCPRMGRQVRNQLPVERGLSLVWGGGQVLGLPMMVQELMGEHAPPRPTPPSAG